MLDIKLIRSSPGIIKENLSKRGDSQLLHMLDDLIEQDRKWRIHLANVNELRHNRKQITHKIATFKKRGEDPEDLLREARHLDNEITASEKKIAVQKHKTSQILMRLPNLLHESVPIGNDEEDNEVVKVFGKPPKFKFKPKNHLEIAKNLDLIDEERGSKVAGHGFLYLKGKLVLLDLALQQFAIDFMIGKGYRPIEPPFMLRRKPYEGVTDLADFEKVMYKVENEDLYMIATAEHPLAAMLMNEVLLQEDLPTKLVGVSPCFRREVGTHGKYTKGMFRMHQFNKVEQFVFCLPKDSWSFHEELQRNAEGLYCALGLHFKVVNVCTGDIGNFASKRYDVNIWMADGIYREAGSNSNCTDYQARRLNIRYRLKEGQAPKGFVHTINNTAIATSRTLLAILEQHQQEDGTVKIPDVLARYMSGMRKLD